MVLINYSHAILDQEIQNNGGCLEAAGPHRERLLQPITWQIYLPCTTAQGQYHCASNIISNSHPFHSKWVDPPIPEIQQIQFFTMKIQGQGHGWGHSLKSQCKCNILSTRIPFVPCQRVLPFLRYSIFKIWPWKSKVNVIPEGHIVGTTPYQLISLSFDVHGPSYSYLLLLKNLTLKIQGQCHGWGERWKSHHGSNILLTHIPFVPSQSAIPFLRCSIFRFWPWKSKVKVMGEANVESHNMGPISYRLTSLSFHVNLPSHSWETTFFKFDLENPRSWSWLRSKLKLKSGCNILWTHIPFVPCQSAIPFLRYSIFKIWPWTSKAKVMGVVNVEGHNMCPTLCRLTSLSFHVNLPSHSWDRTFSKFDHENPRSRSWLRSNLKVTKWV